jgi:predicted amidohydrolase/GNAT superfamily N-acetyltransferase
MENNLTIENIEKVELRPLKMSDYQALKQSMDNAYSAWTTPWTEKELQKLLKIFPEGQFGMVVNGEVVGCALAIRLNNEWLDDDHTYEEITGDYTFNTHDPNGDVLYGIDVFIRKEYRGMRLGRRLYDARKELCEQLNLRSIIFGGRIPNYHKYHETLSPKAYIQKVKLKEIYDPILTFQLSNDFVVKKVLKGYMPEDRFSKEFAVLLEWNNIYYRKVKPRIGSQKSVVRLGLVQWQMRRYRGMEDLTEQMEYFVDAVAGYNSDFVLFPEFFNAPLMADYNELSASESVRKLAEYTEEIRDLCLQFAVSYNVNIITGSMPYVRDGKLYNVGYLCRRDGTYDWYEKMHVTPDESQAWGMVGGERLKVFDTDCGKVGVLICYDVEFPELPRLMAREGMQILFVPFLTDTQNGYSRVRFCAHARAIENECYVAIAGSVGNLPKVHNMDMQFGQSVVFTPCDFAFPTNGVKAEATTNTEMILVTDVDLDLLRELHHFGSVRNLKDRREDLYVLRYLK